MRIRKRPMLPFFSISPSPQIAPDLPQEEKDVRLSRAREKLQEEEEDDQGAEAKERGSGFDPTTHHWRNRSHEEMKKRCCMVSTPIPKQVQVEAMEVKGEEREHDEDDEKWTPRDMSSKRNGRMNYGSAGTSSRQPSSSPEEGENALPFKKRKAHYQWPKDKKIKTKLKRSNTPKKLDEKEDETGGDDTNCVKSNGSAVLMEGSRCSRVNGRGWRCCQQTLVGYSLCEHHLGKGRLRSMTSVRSRTPSTLDNNRDHEEEYQDGLSSSSPSKILMHEPQVVDQEEEEDHEKLTSMVMNKKKKMMIIMNNKKKRSGMVKARSISSLLGQTHHATTPTLLPGNALV